MNRRPEAEAARVVLQAETGSGSAPLPVRAETETGSGAVVRTPAACRAAAAVRHHARELWLDPGRLLHSLYHGRPGSMAGHIAGTRSLGWVPPEMAGKQRAFVAWSGIAWRLTIGLLLKNLGNGISAAADSFFVALVLTAAVVLLIVLL